MYLLQYLTLPQSTECYMEYIINVMTARTSAKNIFCFRFAVVCICAALSLKMAEHSNSNLTLSLNSSNDQGVV